MTAALELRGLVKRYGARTALNGLDLTVPAGCILGLVGSNGAGKTTTMRTVVGLARPDAGTVSVLGQGPFDPARHAGRVSLLPQDSQLPGDATVREALCFYAELQGLARSAARAEVEEALAWVHLSDRAESKIRTLSHGMRRRATIAQAFLGEPELVLLDEPLSGLDPREVVQIRHVLRERHGSQTMLISSHNLHEVERTCDQVAFLEGGQTVRVDSVEAITGRRHRVQYHVAGAALPIERLQERLPAAIFEVTAVGAELTCRWADPQLTVAAVNRMILPLLLAAGVDVLRVQPGSELEAAYLEQYR